MGTFRDEGAAPVCADAVTWPEPGAAVDARTVKAVVA